MTVTEAHALGVAHGRERVEPLLRDLQARVAELERIVKEARSYPNALASATRNP